MGNPAARLGDTTVHGGVILLGYPTVLIGGMPAARIGDMHVCPMLTGLVPHVGGPIMLGSPMVLIGGMPAARAGDMAICAGPPDTIAMGCPTVLIGEGGGGGGGAGGGAAGTAKGGSSSMIVGELGAIIVCDNQDERQSDEATGETESSSAVWTAKAGAHSAIAGEQGKETEGPHWIEYRFVDSAGNPVNGVQYEYTNVDGHKEKGRLNSEGGVQRSGLPAAGQCNVKLFSVSNARWSKNKARVGDMVKLSADVEGHENGKKAVFEIWEKDIDGADDFITKIETTVSGNKVEAEWKYEYIEDTDEVSEGDEKKGYSSPEYYFIVKIEEGTARSGLLRYKDHVEIRLKDTKDRPVGKVKYKLLLPDGEIKKGTLDSDGKIKIEEVPPGKVKIEFEKASLYKGVSKKSR